jgi:hypothetical protein
MPLHDGYARITPYELLLPSDDFPQRRFPAIEEEAEQRGGDLGDPESFALLGEVGMSLRTIRGEEEDPALIQQHGALFFHAFHFWREGRPLFLARTGVVRFLTETGPPRDRWEPRLPAKAGYVQLPQHLVWGPREGDEIPESVDGLFWAAPDEENVSLLVAMGVRKDRPGISVVPLPLLPLGAAAHWASTKVREEGKDFAADLPGAELENLYALRTGAEAVGLAMRIFWYLHTFPDAVGPETEPPDLEEEEGETGGSLPRPSRLPYRPILLEEG